MGDFYERDKLVDALIEAHVTPGQFLDLDAEPVADSIITLIKAVICRHTFVELHDEGVQGEEEK